MRHIAYYHTAIDPPGPRRIGSHYFHSWYPSVRLSVRPSQGNKTDATALKQNTLQRYMGPGGSL